MKIRLNDLSRPRSLAVATIFLTAVSAALPICTFALEVGKPAEKEFFTKEVLPLLEAHCFKCHGAKPKIEGSLRLTVRQDILKGGDLGPAVELKAFDDSPLLQAINYDGLEMPPTGKLAAEDIEVLSRWVKMGLPWSGKDDYGVAPHEEVDDRGDGRDYWAYQQIKAPKIPAHDSPWVKSPIDALLLAKLQQHQLEPNGRADKVTLIRRAYYDLIGLPPTPQQIKAFLEDKSDQAFERVIDELLESPQYGERWGRHWLDLVRYAETHGYERDSPKPEAWRYRDYVIKSFNADKPYDQFVIEQLAGDELPKMTEETLTATGFYRLGIWDDEPADRELAFYDGLDDVAKTAAEAILGTTMGCARCHSHKADPIQHAEYYQFLAYFHDIEPPNRENLRNWNTPQQQKQFEAEQRAKADHEKKLDEQIRDIETKFRAAYAETNGVTLGGGDTGKEVILFPDSRQQAQEWEYSTTKPSNDWVETDYSTTSWDKGKAGFGVENTPGAVVRTKWQTSDIWLRKWFDVKEVPKALALDVHHDEDVEVYINGTLAYSATGYISKYKRVGLSAKAIGALKPGRNVIAIHCRQTGGGQYIDAGLVVAVAKVDFAQALKEDGKKVLGGDTFASLKKLRKELQDSRKRKLTPPGTRIMSVSERGTRPVHILVRGNPQAKSDEVKPGVPAMLGTQSPQIPAETPPGTSGKRLALARWMFADDNPLSARVVANRLWQHHFGRAIVPTPNDFGKLGTPPTHPQLLDYLASEVREGGWKLKRMHKLIMMSAAYQMSSSGNEKNLETDPSNQWLWRYNMRRLSAEEIRDSILAMTGELNLQQFGPSIYVPIPAAVLQGQSRPGAGWGKSPPEQASRRSVYVHVKRSLIAPILEMHDLADTDSSCPVRYVTTVPTQSLGMLNGEFMMEKASKFAARLRKHSPESVKDQIRAAVQLTTGREPAAETIAEDLAFIEELKTKDKVDDQRALMIYCLLVLNTNEFAYID